MPKFDKYKRYNHKSGLSYSYSDCELTPSDEYGLVLIEVGNSKEDEDYVYIAYEVTWDKHNINFVWEPDGEATYVDYGSQSVLYDDGSGSPDYVEVTDVVEVSDYSFEDADTNKLSWDQVLDILGCSKEDLLDLVQEAKPIATKIAEADLEEYYSDYDNWPDKEVDEPDFDPYDWM